MNTELTTQIQGLTHRQLVRFGRICGVSLGDYMKLSKAELCSKILSSPAMTGMAYSDEWCTIKMLEAFPQGVFHRGEGKPGPAPRIPASDAPKPSGDDMATLAALLAKLTGGNQQPGISEARVLELIEANTPETPTFRVEVKLPNRPDIKADDAPRHSAFKEVLASVAAGQNVLLVGPAGCGKTHLCEQVAKALSMRFGFTGAVPSEYKLLGFMNAKGELVRTVYRDMYENGGVFLWDEMDASSPNAMLSFNAGLANGHQDFPDMVVPRHTDFRAIASANTYGNGADRQYVGRNQLDAASLDRFAVIPMDYDETLERTLFGDDEWVTYVHKARRAVRSFNGAIRHVISMRAIDMGQKLLAAGVARNDVERSSLWKHLSAADITKIKGAM